MSSGGSRGGSPGARPPLFWVKKEEMNEGRKGGREVKQHGSKSGSATDVVMFAV